MPEYAKKIGKLMADFRSTTNEFKETWQREVNFEEETKAFRIDDYGDSTPSVPVGSIIALPEKEEIAAPEIKEIDAASFPPDTVPLEAASQTADQNTTKPEFDPNDKRNWL